MVNKETLKKHLTTNARNRISLLWYSDTKQVEYWNDGDPFFTHRSALSDPWLSQPGSMLAPGHIINLMQVSKTKTSCRPRCTDSLDNRAGSASACQKRCPVCAHCCADWQWSLFLISTATHLHQLQLSRFFCTSCKSGLSLWLQSKRSVTKKKVAEMQEKPCHCYFSETHDVIPCFTSHTITLIKSEKYLPYNCVKSVSWI